MAQKSEIANVFVQEFVRRMILNSRKNWTEEIPEIKETGYEPSLTTPQITPITSEIRVPIVSQTPKIQSQVRPLRNFSQSMTRRFAPPFPQKNIQRTSPSEETLNLGKINGFLADPGVESIECQGANKEILVKKSGLIQRTPLSLNEEEVKQVITEFSQKTKIPLIEGTFKAAFENLIMTAVVSEFVGTRFVIQKKTPFRQFS